MPRGFRNDGQPRRPKGTWKAEQALKRAKRAEIQAAINQVTQPNKKPAKLETDEQISKRINDRIGVMKDMTENICQGNARAMIVSGPPGLGKSFEIERKALEFKKYDPSATVQVNTKQDEESGEEYEEIIDTNEIAFMKGFSRTTGIYQILYRHRFPGHVIVFDDCDSVFDDVNGINLLKAATDTTPRRIISWGAMTKMEDEAGNRLPTSFEFEGSIIFISNINFVEEMENGSKRAPHIEALMSRCHYIDMEMQSLRYYLIRIKQVIKDEGMLNPRVKNQSHQNEIIDFIFDNAENFRELTLRTALKIADLHQMNPRGWKTMAKITQFRKD